jgi:exosome complex component RRP46
MTTPGPDGDVTMGEEADGSRPEGFVRETVEDRLYKDYSWKIDSI